MTKYFLQDFHLKSSAFPINYSVKERKCWPQSCLCIINHWKAIDAAEFWKLLIMTSQLLCDIRVWSIQENWKCKWKFKKEWNRLLFFPTSCMQIFLTYLPILSIGGTLVLVDFQDCFLSSVKYLHQRCWMKLSPWMGFKPVTSGSGVCQSAPWMTSLSCMQLVICTAFILLSLCDAYSIISRRSRRSNNFLLPNCFW